MTEEVMEQVRERIAKLEEAVASRKYKQLGIKAWQCTPTWVADHILAIPEILIKDPDQSLPKTPSKENNNVSEAYSRGYYQCKYDIRDKENWVKVLPKELDV